MRYLKFNTPFTGFPPMSRRLRLIQLLMAVAALYVLPACHAAHSRLRAGAQNPDQIFIALRAAAHKNDAGRALELAAQIPDYPVPSYLDYFTIKPRLFDASGRARLDAPDAPVLAFLKKYAGTAIADRMRNDYLLVLGARRAWRDFEAHYPQFALDDDPQVKCYALIPRAMRGEDIAQKAHALLRIAPKKYGEGCTDLVMTLAQQGQFAPEDVWPYLRFAYEMGEIAIGNRMAAALGAQQPDSEYLSLAASQPARLLERIQPDTHPSEAQLALLAVARLARTSPGEAAQAFSRIAPQLPPPLRAAGWGGIAWRAALEQMPDALGWYRLSKDAQLSNTALEWRIRTALLAGDWPMVRWAIESMPDSLRTQSAWVYWYGRALDAASDKERATQSFERIASDFDFYGQLATEALGRTVTLPARVSVTEDEIAPIRALPGFALAQRFYALNLYFEGHREWNWTLRGMNDRQLLAAAEYAKRIQLYHRAINTADRTRVQHDFSLRYLAPLRELTVRYARSTQLGLHWIYGLIRQESRFIMNARSSAGAGGLMQLMPATAQLVARKIGLGTLPSSTVDAADTNILLGTQYLAMMKAQFGGSEALASAAYNAGPARVRRWRAALARPVEGAIFTEAIPFSETRDYVKKVMANMMYYAALFEGRAGSLQNRLGTVAPDIH